MTDSLVLPTGTPDITQIQADLNSEGINEINSPALWRLAEEIVQARNYSPLRVRIGKLISFTLPGVSTQQHLRATVDIDGAGHQITQCDVLSGIGASVNDTVLLLTTDDGSMVVIGALGMGNPPNYHPSSLILAQSSSLNGMFPANPSSTDLSFQYNLPSGLPQCWAEVTGNFIMGFSTGNLSGCSYMIYTNGASYPSLGSAYQTAWGVGQTANTPNTTSTDPRTLIFPTTGGAVIFTLRFGWSPVSLNCYYDGMYTIKVYRKNN